MMRRSSIVASLLVGLAVIGACSRGRGPTVAGQVAPTPRRLVVWLGDDGVDIATVDRMAEAGVDLLVVERGTILLSGPAPVVQLLPAPPVEGSIPVAVALKIRGLDGGAAATAAEAVWSALDREFDERLPAELILDFPAVGEDTDRFVDRLASESGLAIAPLLTLSQLDTEHGRAVAAAAHQCIVPLFGTGASGLRGVDELGSRPLRERLAVARDLGVRVRAAIDLRPKTEPETAPWAEDVDRLTDPDNAEIRRTSSLDRSFRITGPLSWGGREFAAGESLAVAWVDAAKLNLFMGEIHRTVLPELGGWDLVSLPPVGSNLGLDREELLRYLAGDGPAPKVTVDIRRSGRTLTVYMVNSDVFRSAVTGFGNWLQIELAQGSLAARSRGDFDRVVLGSVSSGEWVPVPSGGPDAVRFVESYIAPGEEIRTGSIRLPSSRSRVTVRWQVQLSDGSTVAGVVD